MKPHRNKEFAHPTFINRVSHNGTVAGHPFTIRTAKSAALGTRVVEVDFPYGVPEKEAAKLPAISVYSTIADFEKAAKEYGEFVIRRNSPKAQKGKSAA